ncbi:hypothetical protein ILUMI_16942 [Ignelater luminosus]|uniref:Uncharacterized protein n=1 Tax=Ignelater luminosus TaxID=2038154 RepID=A0A8K0G816_IGNLU|nr:hypothetical protein ILUMI_16942 [Ignelater luminosus]
MNLETLMQLSSLSETLTDEPVRERTFEALIKNTATQVIYNDYIDHYFITAKQTEGKVVACKISLSQPPPTDISSESGFSINIVQDEDGFRDAAKLMALTLGIDKPLFMYLCLSDFQIDTVTELIEALSRNR